MTDTVRKALTYWGMSSAAFKLIAARENQVFRVDCEGKTYALRLHRRGYRSNDELRSELQWMGAASEGGLNVPRPVPSVSGAFLHVADGIQIDVLTWITGSPMGKTGQALHTDDRAGLFRSIGCEMAKLHNISDAWDIPDGFQRCSWDREGLLGENPVWGRFWENPTLSGEDRALFSETRARAKADLKNIEPNLDFGLIHADLVRENILVDDEGLWLIDFDDCGFGFRLFDLATTLIKNINEDDYPDLCTALIDEYSTLRDIDVGPLALFLLLRSATYVGWIVDRMHEEGSKARNDRFIEVTRRLALAYLDE